jgi:hypothetical protein
MDKTVEEQTRLVLQGVKSLLAFYNLGDIVSHDVNSVVNLSLNGGGFWVRPSATARARRIG